MDCTMVAAAPVLPVGYVVSVRSIADRRIILVGYRAGRSTNAGLLETSGKLIGVSFEPGG
jgi:hypothetical protein